MHLNKKFKARELIGLEHNRVLAALFATSFEATIGRLLILRSPIGYSTGVDRNNIAFWMSDQLTQALVPSIFQGGRIVVQISRKSGATQPNATATIDIEDVGICNELGQRVGKVSGSAEIDFPDDIFGHEFMTAPVTKSGEQHLGYQGLLYNLDPGNVHGNLFNVIDSMATAFALTYAELVPKISAVTNPVPA